MSDLNPDQLHHANHNIWDRNVTADITIRFVRRPEYPARDYLVRVDWPLPTIGSASADIFTEKFRSIAHRDTVIIMVPRVCTHWIDS